MNLKNPTIVEIAKTVKILSKTLPELDSPRAAIEKLKKDTEDTISILLRKIIESTKNIQL